MVHDPTKVHLEELIALEQAASPLRLRASHVRARQTGYYLSRFRGRGMEFDESRLYQPGDDVRNIDWRVTARTGDTHTKLFHEERERPVFIAIDFRSPMYFATRGQFKSVLAAKLGTLLAWAANRQGDRVGGLLFNEFGYQELRPRRGKKGVLPLLNSFVERTANPPAPESEQADTLAQAMQRLQRIAHPGSLVCVISDFRGFQDAVKSNLVNISRHNDLMLIQVYDPLEARLPDNGRYTVTNGHRNVQINTLDQRFRQQFEHRLHFLNQQLDALAALCALKVLRCPTGASPTSMLQQALGVRLGKGRRTG